MSQLRHGQFENQAEYSALTEIWTAWKTTFTTEKNWRSQNFDFFNFVSFLNSKIRLQVSFCCNLKITGLEAKMCVWLFYYFNFQRNYSVLKSKSLHFLLNKNINFNKNETESKMENPTQSFRETNLELSSCKDRKV